MKRTITLVFSLIFLACAMAPVAALADSHEKPPALATVWNVTPKDGHMAELMAAVAEHMAFRREGEDSRSWNVYQPVIGDNIGMVGFRYCCFDWADEDAYAAEDAEKGFGDHWNANVDKHVAHYEHYLTRIDLDNGHWDEEAGPWEYFGVTTWAVKPGKGGDFNSMKVKMSSMAKDNNWAGGTRYWSWFSRIGGKPEEAIVSPHKDYASMAPPEQTFYAFVVEQVGEEEADAMFNTFSESSFNSRYTVYRHIKELSIDNE